MNVTAQIGLVHVTGFYGRAIQAFQHIEDHGDPKNPSWWNHAVIAVDETHLVEAAPGGARLRPISDYTDIRWSQFLLTQAETNLVVKWMLDRAPAPGRKGAPYAYEDILFIAIAILSGEKTPAWIDREIASDGRWICSAMVDAAYHAAGWHLFQDRQPAAVFPATIARLFEDYGW
jgi:hypothetical protein